eukprot:7367031-Pyramimonas_sp.AAC.1
MLNRDPSCMSEASGESRRSGGGRGQEGGRGGRKPCATNAARRSLRRKKRRQPSQFILSYLRSSRNWPIARSSGPRGAGP